MFCTVCVYKNIYNTGGKLVEKASMHSKSAPMYMYINTLEPNWIVCSISNSMYIQPFILANKNSVGVSMYLYKSPFNV